MAAATVHRQFNLRTAGWCAAFCGALTVVSAAAAPPDPVTIERAPAPVAVPPAMAAASAPGGAASASDTGLKRSVIEDDNVRIEETRLRGLPTRITVRNKSTGGSSYEILTGPNGRDPTQDKGVAGQRAWSVFDF